MKKKAKINIKNKYQKNNLKAILIYLIMNLSKELIIAMIYQKIKK